MSVQKLERRPYHIIQIMCIMNQLHRLAVPQTEEELPANLTVSQLAALGFLAYQEDREVYQRDLENFFKLRRSTLSSLLNTLEKKDILRRVPVSHDARLKKLVLTEQGQKLAAQVQAKISALNSRLIQGLSQADQQTLGCILEKIECNLNTNV